LTKQLFEARAAKEASKTSGANVPLTMRTLQALLVILDGQKLTAGYLTPKATALETAIDLKNQANALVLNNAAMQPPSNVLFAPAWVASLRAGKDAIYLNGVDGNLDLSKAGPAYVFTS
jgi:hypothetical protein